MVNKIDYHPFSLKFYNVSFREVMIKLELIRCELREIMK